VPDAVSYAIIGAIVVGAMDFIAWHVAFGRYRDSTDERQVRLRRMMFWAMVPPGAVLGAVIGYMFAGG
jgi:hypothetical protein